MRDEEYLAFSIKTGRMGMHNYRELKIWQRSMDFVVKVYEISTVFPKEEKYGLTAQLRSCAVSVPSNISEGAGRGTRWDQLMKYKHKLSLRAESTIFQRTFMNL